MTKSNLSSPFQPDCVLTHGVKFGNIHDQRKTTQQHFQPQQTAAQTAVSRLTSDPTVHHVPVSWILVLAHRLEKKGQGEKRGGGRLKELAWRFSLCYKMEIMLYNWDLNGKNRRVQFHKLDLMNVADKNSMILFFSWPFSNIWMEKKQTALPC